MQINNRDEENPTAELIVEDIQSLKEVREKRVKRLELRSARTWSPRSGWRSCCELAKKYAGATPRGGEHRSSGRGRGAHRQHRLKVDVTDTLIAAVDRLFGEKVVELG